MVRPTEKALKNLKPCKKGETANPNGRPKSLKKQMQLKGLSNSQINELIEIMLEMNIEELKTIAQNPKSNACQIMVAKAIARAIQSGDISQVFGILLNRAYGSTQDKYDRKLKLLTIEQKKLEIKRTAAEVEALEKLKEMEKSGDADEFQRKFLEALGKHRQDENASDGEK